eukprot:6154139-Amphidinium_carterae.1
MGQCWKTASGAWLCFYYNVGKCDSKKKDVQRCSRGWHLCAFKLWTGHACGAPSPLLQAYLKAGCASAWSGAVADFPDGEWVVHSADAIGAEDVVNIAVDCG